MKSKITWYQSLDSTNNEALRQIGSLDSLSVIASRFQTAGRGQRGNSWTSRSGENLMFSIVLKNGFPVRKQFVINEMASLSVVKLLERHSLAAKIKWPNDIYVGDRKICGILIENSVNGDKLGRSIIGIGINVNQRDFPENLPNPTSMLCEGVEKLDPELLLEDFMRIFENFLLTDVDTLRNEYLGHMYRFGEECEFKDIEKNKLFKGTISGVDEIGRLLIKATGGEDRTYGFKEVAFVI